MSHCPNLINETAREQMNGLLQRLAEGDGAADALYGSQNSFPAKCQASASPEPYIHPYFWAVSAACGDGRTRWAR